MKQAISRNIAIISAVFLVAFSVMFITNYFQVRGSDTLQSEVLEQLKQTYENHGNHPQLQEQIRTLDLLARKAYFVNLHRLKVGVVLLLGMAIVFAVNLRIYFSNFKNIPDKDINPLDDWFTQSKTRKVVVWIMGGLVTFAVLFAGLASPHLKGRSTPKDNPTIPTEIAVTDDPDVDHYQLDPQLITSSESPKDTVPAVTHVVDSTNTPVVEKIEISKVTHHGFRGNHSLALSSAKNIPTSWDLSSGKNILWKVDVPRKGYNSPVINGNKVFFSGADEEVRELFCYELSSGKMMWRLEAKNIPGSTGKVPKTTEDTGLAASSVATNGKQVCAIFATGDLICSDMDGKLLWAKNLGVPDNHYGYASSLLMSGNSLFVQYDNYDSKKVFTFDTNTGNQKWAKDRSERHPAWTSPILISVNNQQQLILIGNPGITSYNPNTGDVNWRVECMSGEPTPSAAYANGIVYGASEYATLIAINAEDGSTRWKANDFLPEVSSPVATKDHVFIATDYGVVASFDSETGKLVKHMELDVDFYSSPIIVEGKIYLISKSGKVHILSSKGDFDLINSFETGQKTFATPAFTDKKIVIRTEKSVYCVSSEM